MVEHSRSSAELLVVRVARLRHAVAVEHEDVPVLQDELGRLASPRQWRGNAPIQTPELGMHTQRRVRARHTMMSSCAPRTSPAPLRSYRERSSVACSSRFSRLRTFS